MFHRNKSLGGLRPFKYNSLSLEDLNFTSSANPNWIFAAFVVVAHFNMIRLMRSVFQMKNRYTLKVELEINCYYARVEIVAFSMDSEKCPSQF